VHSHLGVYRPAVRGNSDGNEASTHGIDIGGLRLPERRDLSMDVIPGRIRESVIVSVRCSAFFAVTCCSLPVCRHGGAR